MCFFSSSFTYCINLPLAAVKKLRGGPIDQSAAAGATTPSDCANGCVHIDLFSAHVCPQSVLRSLCPSSFLSAHVSEVGKKCKFLVDQGRVVFSVVAQKNTQ